MRAKAITALIASIACQTQPSSGQPCDVDYDCASGETCWTTDGTSWSCMPSGPAGLGQTCASIVNEPAACGDGLACLANGDPQNGACVLWCDASHACPSNMTCTPVNTSKGAHLHFCL